MTEFVPPTTPAILYFRHHNPVICSTFDEFLTHYRKPGNNEHHGFCDSLLTLILFLICPGFIFFVPLTTLLLVIFTWSKTTLITLFVLLLVFTLLPICFYPRILGAKLFQRYLDYFDVRLLLQEPLVVGDNHRYIFAAYPHGTFAMGDLLALLSIYRFNRFTFRGAGASILLRIPLIRQFLQLLGLIPASYRKLKLHLLANENVGINIGGIADLFAPQVEGVGEIVKTRSGVIRLASECGNTTIVPVYIFGNRRLFSRLADPCGCLRRISRWMRLTVTCFWGRYCLPIPRKERILIVLGKQIEVAHNANRDQLQRYQLDLYTMMLDAYNLGKQVYDVAV